MHRRDGDLANQIGTAAELSGQRRELAGGEREHQEAELVRTETAREQGQDHESQQLVGELRRHGQRQIETEHPALHRRAPVAASRRCRRARRQLRVMAPATSARNLPLHAAGEEARVEGQGAALQNVAVAEAALGRPGAALAGDPRPIPADRPGGLRPACGPAFRDCAGQLAQFEDQQRRCQQNERAQLVAGQQDTPPVRDHEHHATGRVAARPARRQTGRALAVPAQRTRHGDDPVTELARAQAQIVVLVVHEEAGVLQLCSTPAAAVDQKAGGDDRADRAWHRGRLVDRLLGMLPAPSGR